MMDDPAAASPIPPGAPLAGKRLIVGVAGGIACYKAAALVSGLVQAGATVRVLMTEAATRFVAPLTFQALSGSAVLTSPWQSDDRPDSQHVGLARWAEAAVVAPATADMLAKLAHGLADDVVSLTLCALPRHPTPTPVLLAPAMNAEMWGNPIVQRNLATLRETLGWGVVGPEAGWQACRTSGAGRMSEPDAIVEAVRGLFVR